MLLKQKERDKDHIACPSPDHYTKIRKKNKELSSIWDQANPFHKKHKMRYIKLVLGKISTVSKNHTRNEAEEIFFKIDRTALSDTSSPLSAVTLNKGLFLESRSLNTSILYKVFTVGSEAEKDKQNGKNDERICKT